MDWYLLRRYRNQLGRARSALRELNNGSTNYWNSKYLVPRDWLQNALETRVFELEHRIVEGVGVENE